MHWRRLLQHYVHVDYISSNHHSSNTNVPYTTHKATYNAVKDMENRF